VPQPEISGARRIQIQFKEITVFTEKDTNINSIPSVASSSFTSKINYF
jgi:hypothetical protein